VDMPGGGAAGTAWSTNGRKEGADVIVIEGVNQFDLATPNVLINGQNKGGGDTELPLDSVQEFSTLQNPPAEYGWRDGSAINLGIKSGTNALHGTAYAFGRDASVTDARVFSSNQQGTESIGNLTLEQPGFTLGGPVLKTSSSGSSAPNLSVRTASARLAKTNRWMWRCREAPELVAARISKVSRAPIATSAWSMLATTSAPRRLTR
jgi:hypothetical protein